MITLTVNGVDRQLDLPGDTPLLWVLRDALGLTGTKFACGVSVCGACTVHIDGLAARACVTPLSEVAGKTVVTIEALHEDEIGRKLQQSWLDGNVPQCGYCQPGQLMSASALLRQNPNPSDADIDKAMSGNLCRCGTYTRIRTAIKQAAKS
ncbi:MULTISPECIES: (2Fe-2S)-binding protein [Methylomonas]|uniref:(2Fe-2S)-binding protein n=1 Tax=Methylomonas TaxID=416 RepID=UPI001232E16F|nr:(2Fe-2S)-binding protein [Methylomonas rhizoryzae]